MIIVRAPLRITFGGGGTDLPSFANSYGGFCVSATISKYAYVAVNHAFKEGIILKYSDSENVKNIQEIKHPIFKEALRELGLRTPQIEIISIADVPSSGAGLGNSGAFTVALLKALYAYKNIPATSKYIAEKACAINMGTLHKTQGKQDEYICAFGGIASLEFLPNGEVDYQPLRIPHTAMIDLEENLMLFYTGLAHDTESILSIQDKFTKDNDSKMIRNLFDVREVGIQSKELLLKGKVREFGELLNYQWELKEQRMPKTNPFLLGIHNDLLINGAIGSKIIGSGQGGFVMVYAEDKRKVRNYMDCRGLEELRFTFDFEGCKRMV